MSDRINYIANEYLKKQQEEQKKAKQKDAASKITEGFNKNTGVSTLDKLKKVFGY